MKRLLSIVMLFLVVASGAMAKGDKVPQYDITGAGSGTEGTVLVKVYVYGKKVKDQDLKRAARQPAVAGPTAEVDHAAFCERFFAADGQCQGFASIVDGSYDRVKTSKGYKVGAILQVNKASLRKELEKAGVVRSLSSGF